MVVSLSNISPKQGSRYYTREGYLSEDEQRSHSQWTGQLTSVLSVSGHVDGHAFALLLQGKNLSGEVLIDKSRLHQQQSNARSQNQSVPIERAGIDLTSSAPKSVSIQSLVFGDSRLEIAHRHATDVMLQVVESRYAVTRITQDKKRLRITTGKLAIAQFHHDTSRALDPQLHTHNVLLNLQQREDGRWQTLDNTAIYRAKMQLGLIYRNELAIVVQQLGYEIQISDAKHGFWELKGYELDLLEQFSKRARHIREVASEDASSQRKAWIASHSHRARKKAIPHEVLIARWQAEAQAVGVWSVNTSPLSKNDKGELIDHESHRGPEAGQTVSHHPTADCTEARPECDRYSSDTEGDRSGSKDTFRSHESDFLLSSGDPSAIGEAFIGSSPGKRMAGLDAASTSYSGAGGSTAGNFEATSPQSDYAQTDAGSGCEEDRSHRHLLLQLADEFAELERVFSGESDNRYQPASNVAAPDRTQPEAPANDRRTDKEPDSRSTQYQSTIEAQSASEDDWSPSY